MKHQMNEVRKNVASVARNWRKVGIKANKKMTQEFLRAAIACEREWGRK